VYREGFFSLQSWTIASQLTITPMLNYLSSSPFCGGMKARLVMAFTGDTPLESVGVVFPGIWHTLSPLEVNTCTAP